MLFSICPTQLFLNRNVHGNSRRANSTENGSQQGSLGELLATSRRPNLREKISGQRASQNPTSEALEANTRRSANRQASSSEASDFGGSLGDILRPRDESEIRDRRRFYSRSLHERIEAEAEQYLASQQSHSHRSRAHATRSGSDIDNVQSEYRNDKSLANRALCRLSRSRFTGTSESCEECSVCLENFRHGQVLATFATGCKHTFHQKCIIEWFKTGSPRCPLCRFDPITGTWP